MILKKIKGLHINGRKELSAHEPVVEYLNPQFVYIPLKANVLYTPVVSVGDEVLKGQVVANRTDRFGHPVHSPVSGKVTSLNKKMWHSSGKMVEMMEIENDFNEKECYEAPRYEELTKEMIVDTMKNAGLVGLGGAGFPTYAKYTSNAQADVLIINAAECEPYISADYIIIMNEVDQFLRGVTYMMKAANVKKACVAIKKTKKDAVKVLKEACKNYEGVEVFLLNDVYPAGWEKYIVQQVTKKDYDGLPISAGAIVNNVQTAYMLAAAIEKGQPLIEKFVTLSGEALKHPCNVRVKVGTVLSDVIEHLDGYIEGLEEAYFVAGGPMTGKSIMFDNIVVSTNLGAICAIKNEAPKNTPNCLGCGKCATHCPAYLTPTEIKLALQHNDIELLKQLNVTKCVQCGLCSYVCPSRIEMTEFVGKAKDAVMKAARRSV